MKQKPYQQDIEKAIEVLKSGGIILYPTDTIWGIGCDATNEKAVQRVYEIKKRDDSKSMLILLDEPDKLWDYVDEVPTMAWQLIEYSEKPLTIIYPQGKNLAKNLLADDGSIGIRIVKDEFCKDLMRKFGKPIVSTSANVSGKPAPVNFLDIDDEIKNSVDYIVKWRQKDRKRAKPSSIIKLGLKNEIKIIRE